MYVCISVCYTSRKFLSCTIFPSYPTSVVLLPRSHRRARTKLQWQILQHCLTSCEAWQYQTCIAREHGQLLVLHYTKGVACETRSEPPPSPASLAVGSTPRAKRTCLLSLLDVRNAISLCLHFCCTNNTHLLPEKGGVRINRMYELLEILW